MQPIFPLATTPLRPTWSDMLVRFVLAPLVAATIVYGLVMYVSTGAGGSKRKHTPSQEHPRPS